jgi:hypothetical protein
MHPSGGFAVLSGHPWPRVPMRNLGKNILPQVMRQKQGAFLMTGGAATTLTTGDSHACMSLKEGNEHFVSALLALYPGKPLLEISTHVMVT